MAVFEINRPVETRAPRVVVDAGLAPGRHVFELVVEDDGGLQSVPDRAVVTVGERPVPIPAPPADPPARPRRRGPTRRSPR